jgi:RNA polymerase sigma-70 factor (ECF subfamily)
MAQRDPFYEGILECLPHLRGFSYLLARNHALAEDLVHDTVVRAIGARDQFQLGTNLRGWLIIILRNLYRNERRCSSQRLTVPLDECVSEASASGGQEERLQLRDFERQFCRLQAVQREALLLVGVNGSSYEEAAETAGCAVGTMKSRVSRARLQLRTALEEHTERSAA